MLAHDEAVSAVSGPVQPSLSGYAEVRVVLRDVNDNAPVFNRSRLVGKVAEHSSAGNALIPQYVPVVTSVSTASFSHSLAKHKGV